MQSQKSQLRTLTGGGWFNRELKFLGLFLGLISFSNLILSNSTSALFVPTLSASVNQANLQVNGNQVINSTDKTTEIPFNFTVNTNNRTGYIATLSAETENTALTNASSAVGAKIDSIDADLSLNNLPNNTWGYKFGTSMNYAPIPALSTPAQIIQTAGKTNGNESNQLSIGMKLADNLESGNYTNKLILSFVSNPYTMRAVMTNGPDFNTRVGRLDVNQTYEDEFGNKDHIYSIKRSLLNADLVPTNAINIEDELESEFQIKAWFDLVKNTVYFWTEAQNIELNKDCRNMFRFFSKVTSIDTVLFKTNNVEDMQNMFKDMASIENINLSSFNTQKVTNMSGMFYAMHAIKNLNLESFQTDNVLNMNGMFANMINLTSLNLENFNTKKVIDMGRMFHADYELENLDVSSFNTGAVTDMHEMFRYVKKISSLNLSSFNTRNVADMSYMFSGMDKISNLDLSNFETGSVINMRDLFSDMPSLVSLDISQFATHNVANMYSMFSISETDTDKLEKIYVNNNFDTSQLTNFANMFKNRKKLRGGAGSFLPDPSTADKSWLCIDDPTHGRSGYFTRKL